MTDALGAGAFSAAGDTEPTAAVAALRAGADMAMVDASTWQPVLQALAQALSDGALVRPQVDASVSRILAAKGVAVCAG